MPAKGRIAELRLMLRGMFALLSKMVSVCFGEYDFIIIADVPSVESMAAIAIAVAAGGAIKASKTTALVTGAQGVEALKKAATVAKTYKPAR